MTLIKINAITVPDDAGDELAKRFAARAGAVDGQDGFEGFELLQPTDGRNQWLVVTRWRDQASFDAWVQSPAFAHGHAGAEPTRPPRGTGLGRLGAVVLRGRRGLDRLTPAPQAWPATPERLWRPSWASGVESDVADHVVRGLALPRGLVDDKVCALDDTWTGLRIVWRVANR